jgi:NAD+ synthase (glutamine-hydrolysing)
MLIALAQVNLHIGNFTYNLSKHLEAIQKASLAGAGLVVFPELSVCGYPPQDLLEYDAFTAACEQSVKQIAAACKGITAIVGAPVRNPSQKGKRLYNAALVLREGEIVQTIYKQLLPNYDVFDESRFFESGNSTSCIQVNGKKIALTICEDLWDKELENDGTKETGRSLYAQAPMDQLMAEKPELAVNISSSPFHTQQAAARRNMLLRNARQFHLPFLYVNQTGAHTDLLFDGNSMVADANGHIVMHAKPFREEMLLVDTDNLKKAETEIPLSDPEHLLHEALVFGIRDYFAKMGFKKAVLGVSGGIDSAVVLALACRALGAENVLGVMLPSEYSSSHSVSDSLELMNQMGCAQEIISIKDAVSSIGQALAPLFSGTAPGIAEENIQARTRGLLLMAIANKHGHILLNTTNKSEASVGYGTLYGDMCGSLSVLGDAYKTQVYALARYINQHKEWIPENILTKEPSAELRPEQKDSDSLPPYDVLDAILYRYIEKRQSAGQIIAAGFEKSLTEKVLSLVNASEYKRFQMPPVLRVSNKAFGNGRRMPLVAAFNSMAASSAP